MNIVFFFVSLQFFYIQVCIIQQALSQSEFREECQGLKPNERFDCFPETSGASRKNCEARGCCWVNSSHLQGRVDSPYCYFSKNPPSYRVTSINETQRGSVVNLQMSRPGTWPKQISKLKLLVSYETKSRLRMTFVDPDSRRWQVPLPISLPDFKDNLLEKDYHVVYQESPFGIKVIRSSDELVLFDTISLNSAFIYSDQFIQISTRTPVTRGYGFGERRASFMIDFSKWFRIGMWARDQPTMQGANLYGVHNFFMGVTDDATAYGIFLLNSNAQEVAVQPLPALTYRTIGGVLDFFIFTGKSPTEVVQQYNELIGPSMIPPYWSLGFHLCRWGYGSLSTMKKVFERNIKAGIPFDVQWNDIDYMDHYLDWSVDSIKFQGLDMFVKQIHELYGMRYVIIVDPGIKKYDEPGKYFPYDSGMKLGIFINSSNTSEPLVGEVWPGTTVYPDFTNPKTSEWWLDSIKSFQENNLRYDGLWLDMNEPANFLYGSINGCTDNSYDNPPYTPDILGNSIIQKTICPSADQFLSKHYNVHNMYGYYETVSTYKAFQKWNNTKRPFLLSRSTFPGSGRYAAHWSGDNYASWKDMYYSIVQILNFNLFGIPMTGADICGFNGDTPEELCIRWMQLGAFYPFMRNHASDGTEHQDPAAWGQEGINAMKGALSMRYSLLPYLYTLFHRASLNGSTVMRPIFFEFPSIDTFHIDWQFLLGSAILVTPVLIPGSRSVDGFIPDSTVWCDLSTGARIFGQGRRMTFEAPIDKINVHQRGGSILPILPPTKTTALQRKERFTLAVCLNAEGTADGELIWDDGESVDTVSLGQYTIVQFSVDANAKFLKTQVVHAGYTAEPMVIGGAAIIGITEEPKMVTVNGGTSPYFFDKVLNKLYITMSEDFTKQIVVKWF